MSSGVAQAQNSPATLTATISSSLSQDVIASSSILADASSTAPVGVFVNPNSGGVTGKSASEALVVVTTQGVTEICHAARSASSQGGWVLNTIPVGGSTAQGTEVVAGVAYPGSSAATIWGFYGNTAGLYAISLGANGTTWTAQGTAPVYSGTIANLGAFNTPAGQLVVYGNTGTGDLVLATQDQIGGPFVATVFTMSGALAQGAFKMCASSDDFWQLVTATGGNAVLYNGTIPSASTPSPSLPTSNQTLTGFPSGTTVQSVSLGYWSGTLNTAMFFVVAQGGGFFAVGLGVQGQQVQPAQVAATPLPTNVAVVAATGQVSSTGALNVYAVDSDTKLWVLHPQPSSPSAWVPWIPLASGVASIVSDQTSTNSPSLFSLDAATGALRLHRFSAPGSRWTHAPVYQSSSEAFEVVRYRTEFAVTSGNGVPAADTALSLSLAAGSAAAEISIGGVVSLLLPGATMPVTTDSFGRVTIATLVTTSLSSPGFVLQGTGLAAATASPAAAVQNYLSGQGTLNPTNPGGPLPQFDAAGATLTCATVGGQPLASGCTGNTALAGTAASAIIHMAQAGSKPATGTAGVQVTLSGGTPTTTVLTTSAQVTAAQNQLQASGATHGSGVGGLLSDFDSFMGDVASGIENGVIALKNLVVDAVSGLYTLAVDLGNGIQQLCSAVVKDFEDAVSYIGGIFSAIAADIEDVIDWLKEIFDFTDIWATKEAFQQGIEAFPGALAGVLGQWQTVATALLAQETSWLDTTLTQLSTSLAGKTPSGANGAPSGGLAPAIASSPNPAGNASSNWFHDKVSGTDLPTTPNPLSTALETAIGDIVTGAENAAEDIATALEAFGTAVVQAFSDPSQFGSLLLSGLVDVLKGAIDAIMAFLTGLVDAIFAVLIGMFEDAASWLTQTLDLGPINTLWAWIAGKAGSSDTALTPGALCALVFAFPATVLAKVVLGANASPTAGDSQPFANVATLIATNGTPSAFGFTGAGAGRSTSAPALSTTAAAAPGAEAVAGKTTLAAAVPAAAGPQIAEFWAVACAVGRGIAGLFHGLTEAKGPSAPSWLAGVSFVGSVAAASYDIACFWEKEVSWVQILTCCTVGYAAILYMVLKYGDGSASDIQKVELYNGLKWITSWVACAVGAYGLYELTQNFDWWHLLYLLATVVPACASAANPAIASEGGGITMNKEDAGQAAVCDIGGGIYSALAQYELLISGQG